jgi:C-terminal processing protease CtpA/Prc
MMVTLLAASLTACATPFVTDPDNRDDPIRNFDQLWAEFDGYYAFFELKQIDWRALYDDYRPHVGPGTAPEDLFKVMAEMLDNLHDGHVSLHAPFADHYYTAMFGRAPRNFDFTVVQQRYLTSANHTAQGLRYGLVAADVGYVWIPSFGGNNLVDDFDHALAALGSVRGLIVDIRDNEGGSNENSTPMAERLADAKRAYRLIQYRNGPAHDDFTALRTDSIGPAGSVRFTGPVALLTNRHTFSAAEDFALALRTMPHVLSVGDTTGGGGGNPIARELANGWSYRIPRWIAYTPDTVSIEGVGLAPDTTVWITANDAAQTRDTILEVALAILHGWSR